MEKCPYVIEKNDIINKEEFKVIEQIVTCPICCGVIFNPYQCTKCENIFCKDCIENWQKKSEICPFKCEKSKYKESKLAQRILNIIKIKCKNGCNEEISYGDIVTHYDEKCPKIDFRSKYFELKNKYEELLKIKKSNSKNSYNIINNNNNKEDEEDLKENQEMIPGFNFLSKHHKHKLGFVTTNREGWKCNVCNTSLSSQVKSYYCTWCDYDLCQDCVLKERKEKGEKVGDGNVNINNNVNDLFINPKNQGMFDNYLC